MPPSYQHGPGDSGETPCPVCRIHQALDALEVTHAGMVGDPKRWSPEALANKLAPLCLFSDLQSINSKALQLLEYLIDIAEKTQGAEVWRALFSQVMRSLKDT